MADDKGMNHDDEANASQTMHVIVAENSLTRAD